MLFNAYYKNYYLFKRKLKVIEENKVIIQLLDKLVDFGSSVLEKLQTLSDSSLKHLINEIFPNYWYQLLSSIELYIIPFISDLLDDMIPYDGLNEIYRQVVGCICQMPNSDKEQHFTLTMKAILPELKLLSIAGSAGSFLALLLTLISSLLL
ncbi:unnamed protein product [Heterobilharzia americana]|nr:unnamed protein product [Heterobilharzia americana]